MGPHSAAFKSWEFLDGASSGEHLMNQQLKRLFPMAKPNADATCRMQTEVQFA
jgi:hypothetical protein